MSGSGFGDGLTADELLAQAEPLLQIMGRERAAGRHDMEDAIQEARITLWQVSEAKPEAPAVYVRAAAKTRMTEYLQRGKATGAPSHRGRQQVVEAASLDDSDVTVVVRAVDNLDAVLLAYHQGEILDALNHLPEAQREYVLLRFWGGLTNTEIAARTQSRQVHVERAWREQIRPRLADELAHLGVW